MSAAGNAAALERIRLRLADFYPPWEVDAWLGTPQVALEGDTPLSVIAGGRADLVERLVDQIAAGDHL